MASDLSGFIDALELRNPIIIGHSRGGRVAILYAATNVEKVGSLVIVDIGPEINPEHAKEVSKIMQTWPSAFDSLDQVVEHRRRLEPFHSEEMLRRQARYSTKKRADGKIEFKHDGYFSGAPAWAEDLWPSVPRVTCPVLLLRGKESLVFMPRTAERMRREMPDCRFVEIERAGHTLFGDNPAAFEKAVRDFLKDMEQR